MARNPRKPAAPTKKHLARLERERRQTRIIVITSVVVVLAVVLLIGYGILNQTVLAKLRPVAVVNGDNIRTSLFQAQTRYVRYAVIRNAMQTYQMVQYFGQDPSMAGQFIQQLQQYQAQLSPVTIGNQVLDNLIDDRLIRQEAARRGITVSDEEIQKAFEAAFGFFPDGTDTPTPTFEPLATSTYSVLQMTLIPPTPTETITPTMTATATITPTATLTPTFTATASATLPLPTSTITGELSLTPDSSPTATDTPTATPTDTATPTNTATPTQTFTPTVTETITPTLTQAPTSTPTPYTTEGYAKLYQDSFTQLEKDYGITADDLRYVIESQLYRQKVMEAIVGDLPPTEEQVWAEHILVADETLAKDIRLRLEEGEDWTLMARTYSTDDSNKNNSGDLGWFGKGRMVKVFEDAAFALKVGEISQPVKSDFGWHIIRVLGHEDRPLNGDEYDALKNQKFTDWLTEQRNAGEVQINDFWTTIVPAEPTLPPELEAYIQQNTTNQPGTQPQFPTTP
jgi:peptidyl-prolyl cis-trans isomerase D